MLQVLPRDEFLRLLNLKSTTFDQRTLMGQTALALGVSRPARPGLYLCLDALAVLTISMLHGFARLELKEGADAVRTHWRDWLGAVTKAERFPIPELFFTVFTMADMTHRVVVGDKQEAAAALGRFDQAPHNLGFVSIHGVLQQLRANARLAKPKIVLPERFTVAPNEPGYKDWCGEIDTYRGRAEARFKAKTKAKAKVKVKGQRPARAPARKRLVTAGQ